MNVIIMSSLVSIVTLVILLFNRSTPSDLRIPTAFLGGIKLTAPRKLSLTPPPILLWLCVIFATLGAAIAYWPPSREGRAEVSPQAVVVWVDDTFSAARARAHHPDELKSVASDIAAMGGEVYALSPKLRVQGNQLNLFYGLELLPTKKDIEQHLLKNWLTEPSPFARSLVVDEIARAIAVSGSFSNGKAVLAVVSDAQRNTLQGLSPLKSTFAAAKLFKLSEPEFAPRGREEVVPRELFALWNEVAPQDSMASSFSSLKNVSTRIPVHARPGLFRNAYGEKSDDLIVILREHSAGNSFPLVTACSRDLPGFQELDGFGDLRSLLMFFAASFRVEECAEETPTNAKQQSEPWRFRQNTIWLVPLREDVVRALVAGRYWLPRGFVRGGDALVYVAPNYKFGMTSALLSESLVQLVDGGNPVALYLSPMPPETPLNFEGDVPSKYALEPVLKAPDKTPLAFRAKGSPIFYLRTTLAMPNGELTRSAQWPQFWMSVAKSLGEGGGALRTIREVDAADFFAANGKGIASDFAKFSLRLNPKTLAWEEGWLQSDSIRAGVYLSPATNEYVLLDVPDEENASDFVSVAEFERSWTDAESSVGMRDHVQKERRLLPFLGAMVAVLALFLLWSLKRKTVITVVPIFLSFSLLREARAQNFDARTMVNVETVPFRIMWCKPSASPKINSRYAELRELLARRGTIRLSNSLLVGACKPGSAEFWWTNDFNSLSIEDVRVHISGGGFLLVEGYQQGEVPTAFKSLENVSVGLKWENPPKRGMFYRSFYLLHTFDGCPADRTQVLQLRKKVNASTPTALFTSARFLEQGDDCFSGNEDYRLRSFVNLFYAVLTTDYKEDHMRLPELLDRVRNLGLEP